MNNKVYSEVYQILQYLPEKDYKLIPKEQIDFIKSNIDSKAEKIISYNTKFEDVEVSMGTKILLLAIFYKNVATEDQKIKMEKILNLIEKKSESEKSQKYDSNKIFEQSSENKIISNITDKDEENTALVKCNKIHKINLFTKIKKFVFKILHINK